VEAQAADPTPEVRQVGVMAADGGIATMTGELCVDHAGHVVGEGFTAQANMVSSPNVWDAMAAAFQGSAGPLARRLLGALDAGEAAGGDARGRMSAALLVVEGTPPQQPGGGTVVDLRVDRSEDPLGDLGRLLDAADAFAYYDRATDQLFGGDPVAALASIDRALETLPGEENLRLVRAGALLVAGATDDGLAELRGLVAERPTWEVIVRGFASRGFMTLPEGLSIDAVFAGRVPPEVAGTQRSAARSTGGGPLTDAGRTVLVSRRRFRAAPGSPRPDVRCCGRSRTSPRPGWRGRTRRTHPRRCPHRPLRRRRPRV
jgi:hypothetical protein